jgi:CRISPR-associated protein Cas2
MFVVLAYDVNQKRVGKVMKICRKYLVHVQKSVFEGSITEAKLEHLKNELQGMIDFDEDSICIYRIANANNLAKEQIGVSEDNPFII